MNIWIFNNEVDLELVNIVLKPEYFLKSVILITLDLTKVSYKYNFQPADLINQLNRWCKYFIQIIGIVKKNYTDDNNKVLLNTRIKEFNNLLDNINHNKQVTDIKLPIIFVITKSDIVSAMNEKKKYEENSQYILKCIRKKALKCK